MLSFTNDQMITFLRKRGLEVEHTTIDVSRETTNDELVTEKKMVLGVWLSGEPVCKPDFAWSEHEWLHTAFWSALSEHISSA